MPVIRNRNIECRWLAAHSNANSCTGSILFDIRDMTGPSRPSTPGSNREIDFALGPILSICRRFPVLRDTTSTDWRWDLPRTDLAGLREPFLWPGSTDPRWAAGEPSTAAADRCAAMRIDGTLDAIDCNGRLGICQRDVWPTWPLP